MINNMQNEMNGLKEIVANNKNEIDALRENMIVKDEMIESMQQEIELMKVKLFIVIIVDDVNQMEKDELRQEVIANCVLPDAFDGKCVEMETRINDEMKQVRIVIFVILIG